MKTSQISILLLAATLGLFGCEKKSSNTSLVTEETSADRIWNGQEITTNTALGPYVVGIQIRKGEYVSTCSGALILRNLVITAAHCLHDIKPESITVYFGSNMDDKKIKKASVSTTVIPKGYNDASIYYEPGQYDIGLIKLKTEAPDNFRSVSLVLPSFVPAENQMIYIAGYGNAGASGVGTGLLRASVAYAEKFDATIPELFVNVKKEKTGTCSGDSGGPVFIKSDEKFYLIGVVNGMTGPKTVEYPCGERNYHSNFLYYNDAIRQWVKSIMTE